MTTEDIDTVRRIVREELGKMVAEAQQHRGSQGSIVQHEVPKDYDGLCELERPYYAIGGTN